MAMKSSAIGGSRLQISLALLGLALTFSNVTWIVYSNQQQQQQRNHHGTTMTSTLAIPQQHEDTSTRSFRWAVLLMGGARTYAFTRESLLRHVVHAVHPPMDVFSYTFLPQHDASCHLDALSLHMLQHDSTWMHLDTDFYKVDTFSQQSDDRFLRQQPHAVRLVDEYSARHNVTYDFIVYTRPDHVYATKLDIAALEHTLLRHKPGHVFSPQCCRFSGLCDRLAVSRYSDFRTMILAGETWANTTNQVREFETGFKHRLEFANLSFLHEDQVLPSPTTTTPSPFSNSTLLVHNFEFYFATFRFPNAGSMCSSSALTDGWQGSPTQHYANPWVDTVCFYGRKTYDDIEPLVNVSRPAACHLLQQSTCTGASGGQTKYDWHGPRASSPPPYGDFCQTAVVAEKQTGNPNKQVITFAMFPQLKGQDLDAWIMQGALQNIQDAKLYYPQWIVRIHVMGISAKDEQMLLHNHDNVELVRCHLDKTGLERSSQRQMMTRFLAYDDPTVERMISRDLDSRFGPRELLAVHEWIASGLGFHVMHDHRNHDHPVMGGMFGTKRGVLGNHHDKKAGAITMTSLVKKGLADVGDQRFTGAFGEDQSFLKQYVWPLVKATTLGHGVDLEQCRNKFEIPNCLAFPLETTGHFVGQDFKQGQVDGGIKFSVKAEPLAAAAAGSS